ncbi:MAG: formylglycine-generating enzyme family protein [Hyphomicrobiaceae bacterium]
MPMVMLPKGTYKRGSEDGDADEKPVSEVTIGYHLGVGKHEVTRGQFAAFVAATGHKTDGGCYTWSWTGWKQQADKSWRSPGFEQTDAHPVTCINWNDAMAFVQWFAKTSGQPYRLLSEAEWEYAARAGTTTRYAFGDSISKQQAQFSASATVAVGSFSANAFGLHDMHGNVWEWVEDVWHDNYQGASADGSAWTVGGDHSRHVLRGGSWLYGPGSLRSAFRSRYQSDNRLIHYGFRVARLVSR